MCRAHRALPAVLFAGLSFAQAACQSEPRPWVPPEEHKVTIVSEALFVRTSEGDYVDGYLAEYESQFQKKRMFMVLEIPRYAKGDRIIMSGTPSESHVRIELGGATYDQVPVYVVDKASPNVPSVPNIPVLK